VSIVLSDSLGLFQRYSPDWTKWISTITSVDVRTNTGMKRRGSPIRWELFEQIDGDGNVLLPNIQTERWMQIFNQYICTEYGEFDAKHRRGYKASYLFEAVRADNTYDVIFLLRPWNIDVRVNMRNRRGRTVIGQDVVATARQSVGASPNSRGWPSPPTMAIIYDAVRNDNFIIVLALLGAGADPNSPRGRARERHPNLLITAIEGQYLNSVDAIFCFLSTRPRVYQGAMFGRVLDEILDWHTEEYDVDATALQHASRLDLTFVVRHLLTLVDVLTLVPNTSQGTVPILYAIKNGNTEMVTDFLETMVDFTFRNFPLGDICDELEENQDYEYQPTNDRDEIMRLLQMARDQLSAGVEPPLQIRPQPLPETALERIKRIHHIGMPTVIANPGIIQLIERPPQGKTKGSQVLGKRKALEEMGQNAAQIEKDKRIRISALQEKVYELVERQALLQKHLAAQPGRELLKLKIFAIEKERKSLDEKITEIEEEESELEDIAPGCIICMKLLFWSPQFDKANSNGQEDVTRTPCGHFFHTSCLKKWTDGWTVMRNTCPVCRTSFAPDFKQKQWQNPGDSGFGWNGRLAHRVSSNGVTYSAPYGDKLQNNIKLRF